MSQHHSLSENWKPQSICVNPTYVSLASSLLRGTDVKVCSVIGFPLGASSPKVKALEAEKAISKGAREIDMVINIGALKSQDFKAVETDFHENLVKNFLKTCIVKIVSQILN